MKADKITAMQSYVIVTLSIGITNHVLLTPVLLSIGKRDAWVGTVASIVPSLLFASLLTFAYLRTTEEGIAAGVQRAFGRIGRVVFGVVGVAYAFLLVPRGILERIANLLAKLLFHPFPDVLPVLVAHQFRHGTGDAQLHVQDQLTVRPPNPLLTISFSDTASTSIRRNTISTETDFRNGAERPATGDSRPEPSYWET